MSIKKKILEKESERNKLLDKLEELDFQYRDSCTHLTELNNKRREKKLDAVQLRQVDELRKGFIDSNAKVLNRRTKIKQEIRSLQNEIDKLKLKIKPEINKELVQHIRLIRDKYSLFYRDKTRIPSMRKLAGDFLKDLDEILVNT